MDAPSASVAPVPGPDAPARRHSHSRLPLGTIAPIACMIHCLATPLLLALAPSLAENRALEAGLVGIATVVGIVTLYRGVRLHHRWEVVIPFVTGVAIWGYTLLSPAPPLPEPVLMVGAGLFVAGAMFRDHRLRPGLECH